MPRTKATEPSEQKLLDDIQKFGWHCISVLEEEDHSPFSYTVGLQHTYGHPELLIYGLEMETAHAILSNAANSVAQGQPFDLANPTDELIEGYSCVFVPIPTTSYAEHLGYAMWYYEGSEFSAQQVVWPSNKGRFPWHVDATDSFRTRQPVLGQIIKAN